MFKHLPLFLPPYSVSFEPTYKSITVTSIDFNWFDLHKDFWLHTGNYIDSDVTAIAQGNQIRRGGAV